MHMVIVDHGMHSTSATAAATIVACANNAGLLCGLFRGLDPHEFVFGRLIRLAGVRDFSLKPVLSCEEPKQVALPLCTALLLSERSDPRTISAPAAR